MSVIGGRWPKIIFIYYIDAELQVGLKDRVIEEKGESEGEGDGG